MSIPTLNLQDNQACQNENSTEEAKKSEQEETIQNIASKTVGAKSSINENVLKEKLICLKDYEEGIIANIGDGLMIGKTRAGFVVQSLKDWLAQRKTGIYFNPQEDRVKNFNQEHAALAIDFIEKRQQAKTSETKTIKEEPLSRRMLETAPLKFLDIFCQHWIDELDRKNAEHAGHEGTWMGGSLVIEIGKTGVDLKTFLSKLESLIDPSTDRETLVKTGKVCSFVLRRTGIESLQNPFPREKRALIDKINAGTATHEEMRAFKQREIEFFEQLVDSLESKVKSLISQNNLDFAEAVKEGLTGRFFPKTILVDSKFSTGTRDPSEKEKEEQRLEHQKNSEQTWQKFLNPG